jgi:NAD(P)-dependent dehydrogenase (short-subunit alcohol dehydrogenase family)
VAMTFGARSTADEVLADADLAGRRFLVTGASAGLGVETCRALTARGADVTGTARDLDKARAALNTVGASDVELIHLDLAALQSVRTASGQLVERGEPFDVLINNAGVMGCPYGTTVDGFEMQIATNYLGHFVLTNRLAPLIQSRIVVLTSDLHRVADVDIDDPNFERTEYDPVVAYGRSKTASALFAVALDARLRHTGVRAAAVHPGVIPTELGRHLTPEMIGAITRRAGESHSTFKTIPQGAATTAWAAVAADPDEIGGRYCENCRVATVNDDPGMRGGVRTYATDPAHADALWARTEEWVGERSQL